MVRYVQGNAGDLIKLSTQATAAALGLILGPSRVVCHQKRQSCPCPCCLPQELSDSSEYKLILHEKLLFSDGSQAAGQCYIFPLQLCTWSCCRWVALRPWGLVTCCGMPQQRTAPWTSTLQIVSVSTEICSLNCWHGFKHPFVSLRDFICWWSPFIGQASSGVELKCGEKRRARGSSSNSKRFSSLV